MNSIARVAFGREELLVQTEELCELCGCERGHLHRHGCSFEECPQCHQVLIGCACDSMPPQDAARIVQSLYHQFTSMETALHIVTDRAADDTSNFSYLHHAAMQYLFTHLPDSVQAEISRVFQIRFPGLVPIVQDASGHGYYTAEQLSKALDMPLAEVRERIEAMIAAGQGLRFADISKLRKIH